MLAASVVPSVPATTGVPSAPSAPSTASPSAGFSGSFKTVGAATVAITKSLSVITGVTFSGSLMKDIFMLVPISRFFKSMIISSGMLSAGHFNSIFRLTMFNTPPTFNPGQSSLLINLTGISKTIFVPATTLIKSIWIGSSEITL